MVGAVNQILCVKAGFPRTRIQKRMGKTLVIFDIDGTLVYSNRIDSQCFAQAYHYFYKREIPSLDWRHYPHVTDHTIFSAVIREHFNREVTRDEILAFQEHFVGLLEASRKSRPDDFRQVPFARETVEKLLDDPDFIVGIGTGGWKRPATLKLGHVKIPFQSMHMSTGDEKESREDIINEVVDKARKAAGPVSRIVYVGDAPWDVQTTRRLSMNFIGIRRQGDFEILQQEGAGIVLQDYTDFDRFRQAIFTAEPPV